MVKSDQNENSKTRILEYSNTLSCYIFSRQQSLQPSASFVGMYPPVLHI